MHCKIVTFTSYFEMCRCSPVPQGAVQKLAHTFLEITDRILWPEAATVGCGQRPQHHLSHSTPYLRPGAAMIACGQRPQGF